MAQFRLEIITPEREFFNGMVDSLIVETPDGKRGILAGHTPMVAAIAVGIVNIKQGGEWLPCFASEGFVEVRPDKVFINAQAMEWPNEIDEHRAEEAQHKAEERLRQEQSLREHNASRASLIRAMARLRVKRNINNN